MTGLCSNGTYVYALGDDYYGDVVVERFTTSGSVGSSPYMQDLVPISDHRDAAMEGGNGAGDIWVAGDAADSPIQAYNTSGNLVDYVPGWVFPSGADLRGLTFDTGGYLWVSNYTTHEIYKLDLTVGVSGDEGAPLEPFSISCSGNPFAVSTIISATGFQGEAVLEIYDIGGRKVLERPMEGSFVWNAESVPSGTYLVRIHDESGNMARLSLIKL